VAEDADGDAEADTEADPGAAASAASKANTYGDADSVWRADRIPTFASSKWRRCVEAAAEASLSAVSFLSDEWLLEQHAQHPPRWQEARICLRN
jgi:hypothetical protein